MTSNRKFHTRTALASGLRERLKLRNDVPALGVHSFHFPGAGL